MNNLKRKNDLTPSRICEKLQKFVIGQGPFLEKASVTFWLHNKRLDADEVYSLFGDDNKNLTKSNLFIVGPTGSGKTLALTKLSQIFNLDMMIFDASEFTGNGWKGRDVNEIITSLFDACDKNVERAEKAVIVLDEVDKMLVNGRKFDKSSTAENSLLKMLEGTIINVEGVDIDTKNILFICAGAFEGIEHIIERRTKVKRAIGFATEPESEKPKYENILDLVNKEDLINYGIGHQFMGRFANIAVLRKLNVSDLTKILLDSDASIINSLNNTLQASMGVSVSIDEAGAKAVAALAIKEGTGARGLAQIILPVLQDALFLLEEDKNVNEIILTVNEKGEPYARLSEGPRKNIVKTLNKTNKQPYCLPKKINREKIENFAWRILSFYLDNNPQPYKYFRSMHNLMCCILFFLIDNPNHFTFSLQSIRTLLCDTTAGKFPYATLFDSKIFLGNKSAAFNHYYEAYNKLENQPKIVALTQNALNAFSCNAELITREVS